MLLVIAGLVGLASIGAIVFALRGHSSGGGEVIFGDAGGSAATSVTPPSSDTTPADTGSGGGDIPSLSGTSGPHPPPHNGPGPGPGPGPTHSTTPPNPPPPPPSKYDGPDCQQARRLNALGHKKEAQPYVLTCLAKGGNPYP